VEAWDGTYTSPASAQVTVSNVAPRVTPPRNQFANEGVPKTFNLGSFSDPGVNDGPWNVLIDWGDGTNTPMVLSQQSIPATEHTYVRAVSTR